MRQRTDKKKPAKIRITAGGKQNTELGRGRVGFLTASIGESDMAVRGSVEQERGREREREECNKYEI